MTAGKSAMSNAQRQAKHRKKKAAAHVAEVSIRQDGERSYFEYRIKLPDGRPYDLRGPVPVSYVVVERCRNSAVSPWGEWSLHSVHSAQETAQLSFVLRWRETSRLAKLFHIAVIRCDGATAPLGLVVAECA